MKKPVNTPAEVREQIWEIICNKIPTGYWFRVEEIAQRTACRVDQVHDTLISILNEDMDLDEYPVIRQAGKFQLTPGTSIQ